MNTLLECFQAIEAALTKLKFQSTETATVSSASGLLTSIQNFSVIMGLFVLKSIFEETGPASRKLQSVASDLGVSSVLIEKCIDTFQKRRNNADTFSHQWKRICYSQ